MTETQTAREKLRQVPTSPGVYIFRDFQNTILYIGKAKNLKNRVRSYFQKNKYQTPKNQSMINRIRDLEWIVTGSEIEALLTEANLIRQHKPKYNISLKDDKSFPYIRITHEPFPQVFLTRTIVRDGSRYFGPYTNVLLLRHTLKAIHKAFQIRSCSYTMTPESVADRKVSLCLDYHIKKCGGPCEGMISLVEYGKMIDRVVRFLQGNTKATEDHLNNAMIKAAGEQRYEDAAMIRDQLMAVRDFKERQRKVAADFKDRDVFALAQDDDIGVAAIVRIRQGRIFSREKISLQGLDEDQASTMKTVILQFYLEGESVPGLILVPFQIEDQEEIQLYLRKKLDRAVQITVPQRGEKAREVRIAAQNAKLLLGEWLINRQKRREAVPGPVRQLQQDLAMEALPRRIEAFDISHLGGTNTVASMVCFIDGKPRKTEYRKFNVKTVTGIDDFAAMREVVLRRYKRVQEEDQPLPDLILIDGGKGQLSMAVSALRELGLDYLPVIGLAKRLEEVFMPGSSAAQSIAKHSPGLILLRRIRDEAHRFAVTFQREKRSRDLTTSAFESVSGLGKIRYQKLMTSYNDVQEIAAATAEELHQRTQIPVQLCKEIIRVAGGIRRSLEEGSTAGAN